MPSKKTLHKTVVKLIANIGPERHHRFPWLFSQAEKWESDESRMNSLVQLALLLLPAAHGAIISQRLAGNWGMMSNVTLPYREHCPLTSIHTLTIDNIWQLLCECRCKLQHLQHNNTLQSKSSARHLLELSIQNEGCQGTPNAAHLFEFKVIKGHHGPPVKLRGGQEQAWSVYCPWLPCASCLLGCHHRALCILTLGVRKWVAASGCQQSKTFQNHSETHHRPDFADVHAKILLQGSTRTHYDILWLIALTQILLGDHAPVVLQQLATESVVAAVILQLCIVH